MISLSLLVLLLATTYTNGQFFNNPYSWYSTDKSIKRFAFPKKTTLTLEPTLKFPVFGSGDSAFSSTMSIELPFVINFDQIGLTYDWLDVMWPMTRNYYDDSSSTSPRDGNYYQSNGKSWRKNSIKRMSKIGNKTQSEIMRNRRSVEDQVSLSSSCRINSNHDRVKLFSKFENILLSFGISGKSCLLRAICEIHEFPLSSGYGLLGELLTFVFSMKSSNCNSTHVSFVDYMRAEEDGRNGKCNKYYANCSKSLFI